MGALASGLGGMGDTIGNAEGGKYNQHYLDDILKYLQDNMKDAQGLDTSGLGTSAVESTDPRTREYQMQALAKMAGIADHGGFDAQATQANAQAQQSAAGFEQSQRGAIGQNMQARGLGGSGAELAQMLAAQQGGANQAANAGMQASAAAQQRNMASLQGSGQLGGAIRGQDMQTAGMKDDAKKAAYQAALQKLAATGAARQGMINYDGANYAREMQAWRDMYSAPVEAIGGMGETAASAYGGGGMTGGGGSGGSSNSGNPYAGDGKGMNYYSGDYASGGYTNPISTDPDKRKKESQ